MNLTNEVDKPVIKKTVVVYAGRFQPFHKGHYDAYKRLVNKFGNGNVYIGTSNDTSGTKSPFNFNEKKKIATTMFGIPSNHFIEIRNPYKPVEILKGFDGKTTQYIAAVGDKDANRLQGKYFKPYQGKAGYGYEEIGYVYPVPPEQNPISGTDVRKALGGTDVEVAKKFFLKAYPKFDKDIFKMITNKISKMNELGPLAGKGMAGSEFKLNQKQTDDETLDEDGFPGGIGTGLSLPGGYINGAPKKKDVDKLSKKIHKKDDTDKNYVYDPIAEIIAQAISEEDFNDFINEYLGEADSNPALDKELTYKNTKGKTKKIKARDALRLPKDHPAHIQAAKLAAAPPLPPMPPKPGEQKPKGPPKPPPPPPPMPPDAKKTAGAQKQQGPPPPPPPVKLSGAQLKSPAEKSPAEKQSADKEKKAVETKQHLDAAMKELPEDHQEAAKNVNNPESKERKGMMGNIKSGLKKFGKGMQNWVKHKGEMLSGSKDAVVALANGQKIGSTKNKETGKWEYSDDTRKKQIKHLTHLAIDTALIVGSMALGGAGVAVGKALGFGGQAVAHGATQAVGHAATHGAAQAVAHGATQAAVHGAASAASQGIGSAAVSGAGSVFSHGVSGFATHLVKDIAKHATLEAMGLKAAHAAGAGAVASTLSMGLLEAVEGGADNSKFATNLLGKVTKTMETYKMSDEDMLAAVKSYKKVQKKDSYNDLLKEEVSKSKLENIAHFVKYATERLNLKDKPKVKLLMDGEFSQQKSSLGGYIPMSKEIYVVVPGRMTADICRTIAHELVHRKQDEMGFVRNESDGDTGSHVENQANAVAGILMREYGKINKEIYKEDIKIGVNKGDEVLMGKFKNKKVQVKDIGKDQHGMPTINGKQATTFRTINEELLMEGGAYGHMSHPFDDMNLTFGDLKNIISKALNGDLGVVREKTDGQALAISWKNGRLIAARNKGHIQNYGANAMGINDVASKFAGRGGLTDAYNFAMKDLSVAILGLSKSQRDKVFGEGKCFMNLEVIWPTSVNVIPYGQALLVFHNTVCYDEKGTAIASDSSAARTLAGMIKQINASVQSRYTIQGPPITSIPKNDDLSSKQGKYLSKLSKLQSEFGLSDSDTVSLYHQSWWENFIDTKAPVKADKLTKDALVRRWAFGDKSFKINTISNPELQKWANQNDKVNVIKQQKDNIRPFEEIFLGVGADVLAFVSSVLTVHPDKAIRAMKDRLKSVSQQVRTAGNPAQIEKLKTELARLNQLGGIEKIVASEGLVFFYGGKTYKLTGTFAPLNQILGIFY